MNIENIKIKYINNVSEKERESYFDENLYNDTFDPNILKNRNNVSFLLRDKDCENHLKTISVFKKCIYKWMKEEKIKRNMFDIDILFIKEQDEYTLLNKNIIIVVFSEK